MTAGGDDRSLVGKVAIVTGAGSGVGRAVAEGLAWVGALPVLVGRREAALAGTRDRIARSGGRSMVVAGDITQESAIATVVERSIAEFGGVDVLVMAAGVGRYGPVEQYALADWDATLATNLTGVFLCARAVIGPMRRRGGGAIIAVASGAGKQGYPNLAAYAASKFGLIGFMQSLAEEVAPAGIKTSTVVPGSILTDFGGRTEEEKREAAAADPAKRYLQAADVAAVILFLLRQPDRAWTQEVNLWPR